jgi:hypothetical protein
MKSKSTFILILLTGIFLISSLSGILAEDLLGTYKQYSCVELVQYCGNCSFVNITSVTYPNSSIALSGPVAMTKVGTFYNYSFCNTTVIGTYRVSGTGDMNAPGVYETFNYLFDINATGDNSNFSFFLIIAIISLTVFLIALYSGNEYIMFISSALVLLTGVYAMVYGIGNLSNTFTQMVSFVILGLGILFLILSSLKAIAEASDEGDVIGGYGAGGEDYDYYKE